MTTEHGPLGEAYQKKRLEPLSEHKQKTTRRRRPDSAFTVGSRTLVFPFGGCERGEKKGIPKILTRTKRSSMSFAARCRL